MIFRVTATIVALVLLCACQKTSAPPPKPIRPVLSLVVSQSSSGGLALAGTVQPRVQNGFGFRVLGRLIARPVNIGDIVEKNQILAAIDPISLKLAERSAAADLSNNQAQLANVAGVAERQSALIKSNATTQAQLDAADQALAAAQSNVARAQSAVAKAREELGYAILRSDFAGVVTGVSAEIGQTVSPGQTVVDIAEPGTRDAVVDVPDALAGALAMGERFTVSLQLNSTIQAQGSVREIAPEADAATRTRRIKIALEDPPTTFRLGSTITASVASGAAPVVRLPASAILEKDGRNQVWIVDPKSATVSLRPVEIASEGDGIIDVTSGLEPAMRVVTAGVHSLVEGQSVKIDGDTAP
jgi:RND family efflux transporter MFP subunit